MEILPATPDTPAQTSKVTSVQNWVDRHHRLTVLLIFTVLSLVITWPFVLHLNVNILGPAADGDPLNYVWYSWWYKQALITGQDPFQTHNIFALLPQVQIFDQSFINSVASVPLQWIISPLGSYNLLVFITLPLTGFTTYLLVGEFTKNRLACFMAGFFYTFSTYHLIRATGAVTLSSMEFIPICAWRVFAFYRRPTLLNAILAGLCIGLVPLSEIYYLAYFVLPFGFLFLVGKLVTDYRWFLKLRNLGLGLVALVTALIVIIPVLYPYLKIDPEVQAEAQRVSAITTEQISANLAGYFLPFSANAFFGDLTRPVYSTFEYIQEKIYYLGYVLLALVVAAFFFRQNRHRNSFFWLIVALVSIGLSLGPKVYILDNPVINWPFYKLVFDYPLFSNFRAPARLVVLAGLALAVISSYGVTGLYNKFVKNRRSKLVFHGVMAVLLIASLAENLPWSFPMPSQPVVIPTIYNQIAADPENGIVLELPDLVPSLGSYMFYQTIHHKPIVNGYPLRTTDRMITSVENLPYMPAFIYPELSGNPAAYGQEIYPYNVDFKTGLEEKGITYIILHQNPSFPPQNFATMQNFLQSQLGTPIYNNSSEQVVGWHLPLSVLRNQSPTTYRFTRATGWLTHRIQFDGTHLERFVSQDGQLLLQAPIAGPQILSLVARPFYKPLTLELGLNGQVVDMVSLSQPDLPQAVTFKPLNLVQGQNVVEIHSVEGCQPHYLYDPDSRDPDCFSFGIQQVRLGN